MPSDGCATFSIKAPETMKISPGGHKNFSYDLTVLPRGIWIHATSSWDRNAAMLSLATSRIECLMPCLLVVGGTPSLRAVMMSGLNQPEDDKTQHYKH